MRWSWFKKSELVEVMFIALIWKKEILITCKIFCIFSVVNGVVKVFFYRKFWSHKFTLTIESLISLCLGGVLWDWQLDVLLLWWNLWSCNHVVAVKFVIFEEFHRCIFCNLKFYCSGIWLLELHSLHSLTFLYVA